MKIKNILRLSLISAIILTSCSKSEENITTPTVVNPPTSKILFEAKVGTNYHLFTMNVDGTNETQITNFSNGTNYIYTGDASWKSDGTKIIFTTNKDNDNGSEIYSSNPDGTNLQRINQPYANTQDPKFSPSGSKILFAAGVGSILNYQLFTMDSDGTNLTQVTNFFNGTPSIYTGNASWKSDGTKIIFTTNKDNDNGSKIYISNPDGTNLQRINQPYTNTQDPELSPDGSKILFAAGVGSISNYQLFTMNVDGTNLTQITNFSNGAPSIYTGEASWKSDGKKIIFTTNKDNDNGSEIYISNPDGSNIVRINHNSSGESNPTWKP
ncbi:TolB family protein [Flavobacterium sp.]|jgi:Tol biopolymer transport system component|uniref:TolB family protein n=1 Tax=Flavobacterium sp. TaxID=239 RepID=UPI0037C122E1